MAYKVRNGYQKFLNDEPFVLEPEDWSFSEWAAICKLCGLPLGQTEHIVLHILESAIGVVGPRLWVSILESTQAIRFLAAEASSCMTSKVPRHGS